MLAQPLTTPPAADVAALARFLTRAELPLVLTGAGCSTESGIPDYRDLDGGWKHRQPLSYHRFVSDPRARRRYWAGSLVGWRRVDAARPNPAHRALAALEAEGALLGLVTQNVDGLHQKAGSRRVTDLHGRLDRVVCLGCRTRYPRRGFQRELERRNPGRRQAAAPIATAAPDGDAAVAAAAAARFRVPDCPRCGGLLKPDVVFFGETIPRPRLAEAAGRLAAADALLVVGSSLMVRSGYRFVEEARRRGLPVAAVNLGRTRAESELDLKVAAPCGAVLPAVAATLGIAVAEAPAS